MTLIRLGHSPDPDDAFMFYALAKDLIPTGEFEFEHLLRDIETLNRWAMEGRLEVSAISIHAYSTVSDKYRLLPHGASMGEQYGPMVVAREPVDPADLPRMKVAIPGTLTSAFLELQLAAGRIDDPLIVPFDQILAARVSSPVKVTARSPRERSSGLVMSVETTKFAPLGCRLRKRRRLSGSKWREFHLHSIASTTPRPRGMMKSISWSSLSRQ